MTVLGGGPPLHTIDQTTQAIYLVDKTVLNRANAVKNRVVTLSLAVVALICGVLTAFGTGSWAVTVVFLAAVAGVVWIGFASPVLVARALDTATDGAGHVWVTLTVRPDGLQVDDGYVITVVRWAHVVRFQRTPEHLLLTARGRGVVASAPRDKLSSLFEANLERTLHAFGTRPESETERPVIQWGLYAFLVVALGFMAVVAVILAVSG